MTEKVQELINKIKSEGVLAAEDKAREIEAKAKEHADRIVEEAKQESERILNNARSETKKMEDSARASLQQASRDMLLSLRKEIQNTLTSVVNATVKDTLTAEQLAKVLNDVVKETLKSRTGEADIHVYLNKKDLKALKDGFIAKLQKQIKQPLKFHGSDDISGGFMISYDAGKSSFDFTDESLANYLSSYLNEQVSQILKESVK